MPLPEHDERLEVRRLAEGDKSEAATNHHRHSRREAGEDRLALVPVTGNLLEDVEDAADGGAEGRRDARGAACEVDA